MILLLYHEHDPSAPVLTRGLTDRGYGPVITLTDREIVGTTISHHVNGAEVRTEIRTPSGPPVLDTEVAFVVNRLTTIHPDLIGLEPDDAAYAATEWQAVLVSFLWSLGPRVLNRPDPFCLSGRVRSPEEWEVRARQAGVEIAEPGLPGTPGRVSVIGSWLSTSADLDLATALALVARDAGFRSAEITFLHHGDGAISEPFIHGNVDFADRGSPGVDALAALIGKVAA